MSPEQAKARPADKRSGVWAFGCVLYEMLTAQCAFDGGDVADTLASVLKEQPDWSALPADTPDAIRRLLRRALDKDPKRRLSDMADARLEIDEALAPDAEIRRETIPPGGATRIGGALPWTVAAAFAAALVAAIVLWHPWRSAPGAAPRYLTVDLGADAVLRASLVSTTELAISPDGSMLAFVGEHDRVGQLYLRRFDTLQATPLVTGQVSEPFFLARRTVGRVLQPGRPQAEEDLRGRRQRRGHLRHPQQRPRGASWGDDGSIVFNAGAEAWTPLLRVSSAGGKPEPVSALSEGEVAHRWPQVLPGARAMLFAAFGSVGGSEGANVLAQPLPSGPSKIVLRGAHYARYLRSGHLLYAQRTTLFAVPFDVDRLEARVQPVAVVDGVMSFKVSGASSFDISDNGTLSYIPGQLASQEVPMLWMRRNGTTTPMRAEPRDWRDPRISPDGTRIAFYLDDGRHIVLYTYEWARDFTTRLKFGPIDSNPVWSPDRFAGRTRA
jgi:serine/threonine-protein kinase